MTSPARLELDRDRILDHRRRVQALDERLPGGEASLHRAAWTGLQDSMPRAALLSIHARVADTGPGAWEDPSLVQLWGPRFSAYLVAARDRGVFTLGRLSDVPARRRMEEAVAAQLQAFLDGRSMDYSLAGHALGRPPNSLRYAAPTGTVLIRWDGNRRPIIWTAPPPELEPEQARLELARRHLHVLGPSTVAAFADWAGVRPPHAQRTLEGLAPELLPVRTPVGEAWILAADEPAFRDLGPSMSTSAGGSEGAQVPSVRLLPSGDAYFLLQGADRALLVPEPERRRLLWTSRVWPGALLLDGQIVGTWRRAQATVAIQAWRSLRELEREAVVAEAESLPLPGLQGRLAVRWEG